MRHTLCWHEFAYSYLRKQVIGGVAFLLLASCLIVPCFAYADEKNPFDDVPDVEEPQTGTITFTIEDIKQLQYDLTPKDDLIETLERKLPSKYDSRLVLGTSYLTQVRDQGVNGLCWAFANLSVVESNMLKQKGGYPLENILLLKHDPYLSVKQLSWTAAHPITRDSIVGGIAVDPDQEGEGETTYTYGMGHSSFRAGSILSSWQAGAYDSSYPYDPTSSGASLAESDRATGVVHVSEQEIVQPLILNGELTPEEIEYNSTVPEEDQIKLNATPDPGSRVIIKNNIMESGSVAITYYAQTPQDAFDNTTSHPEKVYLNLETGAQCAPVRTANINPDHTVSIVGWDDNYSKENFASMNRPTHDGAFLVKNSWGSYGVYQPKRLQLVGDSSKAYTADGNNIIDVDTREVLVEGYKITSYDSEEHIVVQDKYNKEYIFSKIRLYPDSPTWQGFFWLSYEDASMVNAVKLVTDTKDASGHFTYDRNYQYDFTDSVSNAFFVPGSLDKKITSSAPDNTSVTLRSEEVGVSSRSDAADLSNQMWGANAFTAQYDEMIRAVGVSSAGYLTLPEVKIYRLPADADVAAELPTAKPVYEMSREDLGIFLAPGFHTIELPVAVEVHKGDQFVVACRVGSSHGGSLTLEAGGEVLPMNPVAKIGERESFISSDNGSTWTDVAHIKVNTFNEANVFIVPMRSVGNLRIKAFTVDPQRVSSDVKVIGYDSDIQPVIPSTDTDNDEEEVTYSEESSTEESSVTEEDLNEQNITTQTMPSETSNASSQNKKVAVSRTGDVPVVPIVAGIMLTALFLVILLIVRKYIIRKH